MPRYLTPNRICLLLLAEIYINGDLATSSKLPVLRFIASRIQLPTSGGGEADATLQDLQRLEDAAIYAQTLSQYASGIPGRTLYDIFLNKIWSLDSLDALHLLFSRVEVLLSSNKVSRSSPLSQYFRRCHVEFTRLQFSHTIDLWNSFSAFRLSTYSQWSHRNPEEAASLAESTDSVLDDRILDGKGVLVPDATVSADDTDGLIVFSIQQLQKLGSRLPEELKSNLSKWITDSADSGVQSRRHFLEFFEFWRAGQYNMALESLHRYFDYSLYSLSAAKTNGSDNLRLYYQYALLHLSVLHADFDCWEESVDAMDECIATARENQDTTCLNYALSWLLYLRQANTSAGRRLFNGVGGISGGEGGEHDEIAFLKTKAKESRQWSLLSSTLLEEAKLDMYSSGSNHRSIEHIIQSGYLNVQHGMDTLMPAASLFQGAFFERLGHTHLSCQTYKSIEPIYGEECPLNDRVRAACRLSFALAQQGSYAAALNVLKQMSPAVKGVLKLEQRLMGFSALVKLAQGLRRGETEAAKYFASQLRIVAGLGDVELAFESKMLEVQLLVQSQQLSEAFKVVSDRIQRLKAASGPDIAQRLHLLVLKGRLFCAAGKPIKAFSISVRAASTAMRLALLPVMIEAVFVLTSALIDLAEYKASRDLLESVLPMAIESPNTVLAAELFTLLARAYSGFAGYCCESGSTEQMKNIRAAEKNIERAKDAYTQLNHVDGMLQSLTMKVRFARFRGDEASVSQAEDLLTQLLADRIARTEVG